MGTKTDNLVEQLADTHKRLRDSSSRSGMSAQDRAVLERQIAKLEVSVADLTAQLCDKGVAYIKKDSMFTMAARQAMSQLVTQQGTVDLTLSVLCPPPNLYHRTSQLQT